MENTEEKSLPGPKETTLQKLFKTREFSQNRVTNLTLIFVILGVIAIGILIMMMFERYLSMFLENRILFRVILMGIIANICILIFITYSFSHVTFAVGPKGPDGIRGRVGSNGTNASINKCTKQIKSLAAVKNEGVRSKTIVIQKPAIE